MIMSYPSPAAVSAAAAARDQQQHQEQQQQQEAAVAVAPQWKQQLRGSESVFKTAVFLGSMIVVAVLLLVLICMARWDSITRLVPVFNSELGRWRWRRGNHHLQRQSPSRNAFRHRQHDLESSGEPVMSTSLSKKNRGTNKRVVEALPIINYVSSPTSDSNSVHLGCLLGSECTICLCDFTDGDRVRVLPDCCHGFHVECVDVWLIAHASCPSCRNNLHKSTARFTSASTSASTSAATVT